jgi:hypothetical protein
MTQDEEWVYGLHVSSVLVLTVPPEARQRAVLEALAAQLMVVVHRAWDAGHAAGKAEQEGGR